MVIGQFNWPNHLKKKKVNLNNAMSSIHQGRPDRLVVHSNVTGGRSLHLQGLLIVLNTCEGSLEQNIIKGATMEFKLTTSSITTQVLHH